MILIIIVSQQLTVSYIICSLKLHKYLVGQYSIPSTLSDGTTSQ